MKVTELEGTWDVQAVAKGGDERLCGRLSRRWRRASKEPCQQAAEWRSGIPRSPTNGGSRESGEIPGRTVQGGREGPASGCGPLSQREERSRGAGRSQPWEEVEGRVLETGPSVGKRSRSPGGQVVTGRPGERQEGLRWP